MFIKWDFFRAFVMAQFRAMREFHEHGESWLQESYHTRRVEIGDTPTIAAGATEEEVEELISLHREELQACDRQYKVVLPRMLRFGVMAMCFALVESNLSRISQEIRQRKQLALDLEDVRGKDLVHRFKKFWTKVAGSAWWKQTDRWNRVKDVQKLRDCIVHRNGVLGPTEPRLPQLIQRNIGVRELNASQDGLIDPDEDGTLFIEEQYCRNTIEDVITLFREIFDGADCFGPESPIIEKE